jgi:hypothetical protein
MILFFWSRNYKEDPQKQILHWPLRRYRVTPRRNPRVFRREILTAIVRTLKHDSSQNAHG